MCFLCDSLIFLKDSFRCLCSTRPPDDLFITLNLLFLYFQLNFLSQQWKFPFSLITEVQSDSLTANFSSYSIIFDVHLANFLDFNVMDLMFQVHVLRYMMTFLRYPIE